MSTIQYFRHIVFRDKDLTRWEVDIEVRPAQMMRNENGKWVYYDGPIKFLSLAAEVEVVVRLLTISIHGQNFSNFSKNTGIAIIAFVRIGNRFLIIT